MASDLNRWTGIGRLVRDPELKTTTGGTSVCKFSLANNKTWISGGEKKEAVSYFEFVAWGKMGEVISQYSKKGGRLGIEGRLQQRSWETDDGKKRSVVEIVVDNFQFLTSKSESQESSGGAPDLENPFNEDSIPF